MTPEDLLDDLRPLYRTYHKNQHGFIDPAYIDDSKRPDEWPTGEHKTYERGETVEPPETSDREDHGVLDALRSRSSFDDGTSPRPISREELFALLSASYGVDAETGTRPVPSAGRKYPLELYPLVIDGTDVESGLYHYNPGRNVLERPADPDYLRDEYGPLREFVVDNWQHLDHRHEVSAMLLVTGIPSRSSEKYGERGYLFTLIEAGALVQSIQLAAWHLGIGSRPYAGFRYDVVADLLGLVDHSQEWVLTSVALADTD